MRKGLSWFCIGLLTVAVGLTAGSRRVTQNKLSPPASTSMQLGGHNVTIEYNAPSARGRKVEGGLIPYDRPWRTGADAATTLSSDADLMIGDLRVPKGEHTLYTAASESGWTLIINKQTGQWGTEYDKSQDLGRVPMKLTKLSAPAEKFEIQLAAADAHSGTLTMRWGATQASVPVKLAQ